MTSTRWHRRPHQDYHSDTVLYTTCEDLKLRIWAATDHHALQALQLWSELDLVESVIPRNPPPPGEPQKRFLFLMDGWEFEATVEHAIQRGGVDEQEKHASEHLMDVAYRNPDVCVILDNDGNMSAWGLERVGCKARQPNDIFNIAIIEDLNLSFHQNTSPFHDHLCLSDFGNTEDGSINVLAHYFDGRIEWLKSPVDRLFASIPSYDRLSVEAVWTGHSEPVAELLSSPDNTLLLSRTTDNACILWTQDTALPTHLAKRGDFQAAREIRLSCYSADSQWLAFLHNERVSIWSMQASAMITEIKSFSFKAQTAMPCLASFTDGADRTYFVVILPEGGQLWCVNESIRAAPTLLSADSPGSKVGGEDELFAPSTTGLATSVAISISKSGELFRWKVDVEARSITRHHVMDTHVSNPKLLTTGYGHFVAISDAARNRIRVWDTAFTQLRFEVQYATYESIEAIAFGRTDGDHSVLAVALQHRILIYVESRQLFFDNDACWYEANIIDIGEMTNLPITACAWLAGNGLICAAGSQLFVYDTLAKVHDPNERQHAQFPPLPLSDVAASLNSSLASFHPDMLVQRILNGCSTHVDRTLLHLHEKLKYWTHGEPLDSDMETHHDALVNGQVCERPKCKKHNTDSRHQTNGVISNHIGLDDSVTILSEDAADAMTEILRTIELPYVSGEDQLRLTDFVTTLGSLERHRKSGDNIGIRYLMSLGDIAKGSVSYPAHWRDIAWASHSTAQDILVDLTARRYQGKMLWRDARRCGMFMWLSDVDAVVIIGRPRLHHAFTDFEIACSIRSDCTKRVYQNGREESD